MFRRIDIRQGADTMPDVPGSLAKLIERFARNRDAYRGGGVRGHGNQTG